MSSRRNKEVNTMHTALKIRSSTNVKQQRKNVHFTCAIACVLTSRNYRYSYMVNGLLETQFSGTLFLTGSMMQTLCILYRHNSSLPVMCILNRLCVSVYFVARSRSHMLTYSSHYTTML